MVKGPLTTLKDEITWAEEDLAKAKRDLEKEQRTARLYDDPIEYTPDLRYALMKGEEKYKKADRKLQRLLKRKGNPTKTPRDMSNSQINARLNAIDKQASKVTDLLIEAGRGNERHSDIIKKTDPLSKRYIKLSDERMDLRIEAEQRYGPGFPGRLPRQISRRRNPTMPKRKASPAQLRALAKGRATLKRMRKAAPQKRRRRNPGPPTRGAIMSTDLPSLTRATTRRRSTQQKVARKTLARYPQTSTRQQGYASNPAYRGYVVATFAPRSERVVFFDGKSWGTHKNAVIFGLKDTAIWAAKRYGKPAVVASVNKAAADIRLKLLGV